jgi:hypothetical protein
MAMETKSSTTTNEKLEKLLGAWTNTSRNKLVSLGEDARGIIKKLILKRLKELSAEEKEKGKSGALIESIREKCSKILADIEEINGKEKLKGYTNEELGAAVEILEKKEEEPVPTIDNKNKKTGYYMTPEGVGEFYDQGKVISRDFADGSSEDYDVESGVLFLKDFSDGTSEYYNKDGSMHLKTFPDGSMEYYDENGEVTHRSDSNPIISSNKSPRMVATQKVKMRINLLENNPKANIKSNKSMFGFLSRGKKPDLITEEKEIDQEIEKLSPEDREKIAIGIHNIGFLVEKKKSEWFAESFDWISKKGDQKGTVARFTRGLSDSFKKDAEMAEKKIAAGENAGKITKLSNYAYLAKNILRPIRLIADVTAMSPTGAQRLVMAGSMVSARITGAMKEARLGNEEVMDQTRIADIEMAEAEAWKIYERAKKKAGPDGNVSALELKTAYLHEIPKDLEERLKNTSVADGMIQGILRKHLDFDINRLNKDIEKIENDGKLSPEKIEAKKEQLLRRWEKRLTDYDRVLTQTGTVDGFAMAARYAETSSKNVARVMTAQTLYLTLDKVWDSVSHLFTSHDVHAVITEQAHSIKTVTKENIHAQAEKITAHTEVHPTTPEAHTSATNIQTEIDPRALIGHNEGIEHAFIRQIEHNKELAVKLGWDGKSDLHHFAQSEAHRVALTHGYVDGKTGAEIRIKGPDNSVAYQLKMDGNEIKVDELRVHGGFQEGHGTESGLEKDIEKDYEYKYSGHHDNSHIIEKNSAPVEHHVETPRAAAPATAAAAETHVDSQAHIDAIKEDINQKIDAVNNQIHTDHTIRTGTTTIRTGTTIGTGNNPTYGKGNGGTNVNYRGNSFWAQDGGQMMDHGYNIQGLPKETAVTLHNILEAHPEFAGNPFGLTPQQIIEVYDVNRENIFHIFPKDTEEVWGMVRGDSAYKIMQTPDAQAEDGLPPFIHYLQKLKDITGLKPQHKILGIGNNETSEQYIARAIQKVKSLGKMGDLETSVEK